MGVRINTNIEAINVHRSLVATNNKIATSLNRLSSGHRINSAKDDAAGFAVANTFRSLTSSLRAARQNASEASSMVQVADGGLNKVMDLLVRMRELATQSAGDQLSDTERAYLNEEFGEIVEEIDRISNTAEYNGVKLLDGTAGTAGTVTFQIGARNTADDRLTLVLQDTDSTALGVNASAVDTLTNAQTAIDDIDSAIETLNTRTSTVGAFQNQLQHVMDTIDITIENFSASESAIRDVDLAWEMSIFTKNQILQQSGVAMLAQANRGPQQLLQLLQG